MVNPSKFEVYGQEMLEKIVKKCGNSGRIYLPPDWVDKKVKIIRIDWGGKNDRNYCKTNEQKGYYSSS